MEFLRRRRHAPASLKARILVRASAFSSCAHIERTRLLLHLVDVSDASGRPDPVGTSRSSTRNWPASPAARPRANPTPSRMMPANPPSPAIRWPEDP